MNNNPLVSILVPIYNRLEFLGRTLQSLRGQSYTNIEVLCVDDGSTQRPDQIIENLRDDRFKLFRHEKNLCLCDSDDIYLPYTIETRLYLLKRMGVDIVYSRALKQIMDLVTLPNGDQQYQISQKVLYWEQEFNRDAILVTNIAPCCCPFFSRKSWETSEYWFDETMRSSEDMDFWQALSRRFDFHSIHQVDCECSFVRNKPESQMTGNRNFSDDWPKMYKHWRHTAINLPWVVEQQNKILRGAGIDPLQYDL
jgi:glycosyltransferase involved in cell wall biosynthesis